MATSELKQQIVRIAPRGLLINFQTPGQNTQGKTRLQIREVKP
ncbi:MAG: hypothetical protein Q8P33_00860 [bacterium]|nr:hypothetical protein [bacterium]